MSRRSWFRDPLVILAILCAPPALYGVLFAEPIQIAAASGFAAALLLLRGLVLSPRAGEPIRRGVVAVGLLLGAVAAGVVALSTPIRAGLLTRIYGTRVDVAGKLNALALKRWKSKWGSPRWPVRVDLDGHELRLLPTGDDSGALRALFGRNGARRGSVTVLLAGAGCGKSPTLRQWTHRAARSGLSPCVLFASLVAGEKQASGDNLVARILADQYRKVVGDPAYYRSLLNAVPCLVFLDDLDEIPTARAAELLREVMRLSRSGASRFVIASRPEAVFRSAPYESGALRAGPGVRFARIGPVADLDFFLANALAYHRLRRPGLVGLVKARLRRSAVLRDAITELDHLQGLAVLLDDRRNDGLTDFDLMARLVHRRIKRNRKTHWMRLRLNPTKRLDLIEREALRLTAANRRWTRSRYMSYSGFGVYSGERRAYRFTPDAFRSWFVARQLGASCARRDYRHFWTHLSRSAEQDLRLFPSLRQPIGACVCASLDQHRDLVRLAPAALAPWRARGGCGPR